MSRIFVWKVRSYPVLPHPTLSWAVLSRLVSFSKMMPSRTNPLHPARTTCRIFLQPRIPGFLENIPFDRRVGQDASTEKTTLQDFQSKGAAEQDKIDRKILSSPRKDHFRRIDVSCRIITNFDRICKRAAIKNGTGRDKNLTVPKLTPESLILSHLVLSCPVQESRQES